MTTSTPGSPIRPKASLRASSPYLVANSTACRPTRPAPRIVTLTVDRCGFRRFGHVRSSAANAAATPFQATLRRFSTSRRPSSLRDEVEAERVDAELAQHRHAGRPGREVEHRHEHRAPAEQVVAALRRPQDHDDVLAVAVLLVGDVDVGRHGAVVGVAVAHPGSDPGLEVDLGPVRRQQPDQRRQEVAPLARLLVHPREPDRDTSSEHPNPPARPRATERRPGEDGARSPRRVRRAVGRGQLPASPTGRSTWPERTSSGSETEGAVRRPIVAGQRALTRAGIGRLSVRCRADPRARPAGRQDRTTEAEMANDRGLTIGFPRMYNEPGERRAFLPPLIGLLASMDVDVYVEAGSGAGMGYADDALPGRVAEGAHRRRGHGVSPGHRGGAAGRPRDATSCSGPARS